MTVMALLEVDRLTVSLPSTDGWVRPVDDVSFNISRGEILGVVGESGCGKSTAALAVMGLLSENVRIAGQIRLDGHDLLKLSESEMCKLRGNRISMIFQEPMTALNPVKTIGFQIMEPMLVHTSISKTEARARAIDLLSSVGIDRPAQRMDTYPHQLSGGQRQRIVIAMALACEPDLIVADEPTTALDTTVQRQILDLLLRLVSKTSIALMLITHNLAVVSEVADRVMVMYGGRVAETGPTADVLAHPVHPYTRGLIGALPRPDLPPSARLIPISGVVPRLADMPSGCALADRCPEAIAACRDQRPAERMIRPAHQVACIRA
jgi:peptide/nickel transport system ATP-binding protein